MSNIFKLCHLFPMFETVVSMAFLKGEKLLFSEHMVRKWPTRVERKADFVHSYMYFSFLSG